MFPFLVNAPTIEYPLSGDVTQDVAPSFFTAMNGVAEIEKKIVFDVASYGDQLGTLTDAILELAELTKTDGPNIAKLEDLAKQVAETKISVKDVLRDEAETALKRLQSADPDAHAKLVATLKDSS